LKPTSSYIREGSCVEIPPSCTFLDHEVELGVVIGKKARDIHESQAMDHVSGTHAVPPFRAPVCNVSHPLVWPLHEICMSLCLS
jgi:hypothetical protein